MGVRHVGLVLRPVAVMTAGSRPPQAGARGSSAAGTGSALARLVLVPALILAALAGPGAAGEPGRDYRFGVFPYLPVLTIDRIFGPITTSFSKDLGRPVQLKTKSNFEKFADELAEQSYDIIFVHPFFYVDAADKYHYRALARLDQQLTGVVMIGENRDWHEWRDLKGRTLALPPALAAVSELVKGALIDAGLRPGVDVIVQHYRTKTSCLQAVMIGAADACAIPGFVLAQIESVADMRLHVMIETAPIHHFVFAVHERVPEADRAKVLGCILGWSASEAGRAVLAAGAWSGFVPATDQDYDQVRRYSRRLRTVPQH
jgi:ABC-type phosphate/phosphonate transport system substrate-binding protein